jgi:hypothetical protein
VNTIVVPPVDVTVVVVKEDDIEVDVVSVVVLV